MALRADIKITLG